MTIHYLDWPAPKTVKACFTQRQGGRSDSPFGSFNLGLHVGDDERHVSENRLILSESVQQNQIHWLEQVHSSTVVNVDEPYDQKADASFSKKIGQVCSVMTADCLPVFLCDEQGTQVAVAHAGWRGLCNGVIQNTASTFKASPAFMAYLGPAISQGAFEVGDEVRLAFNEGYPQLNINQYFISAGLDGKWLADLYGIAREILNYLGIKHIYGGDRCTFSEEETFFSFRRDHTTGRMANLIWLESPQ